MIPVNRPLLTQKDKEAVLLALDDAEISGTSRSVMDLENKISTLMNVKNTIAVSSGTSALDCLIEATAFNDSQHALVPNTTIISGISHLIRRGIRIRTVDVDLETFMPSVDDLFESIDDSTKVVIPTHIYGLASNTRTLLERIATVGKNTLVYEDAAESFGVKLKDGSFAGTNSDAATFSFYANKNVTGGEGGAIVTNNDDLANHLREIRNLGFSQNGPRFVNTQIGWNARIHGLSAALISSQIDRIEEIIEAKRDIGNEYLKALNNHPWLTFQVSETLECVNAYWVFSVRLNDKCPHTPEVLAEMLKKRKIETRRFFYPISRQPVLIDSKLLLNDNQQPNSTELWDRGLYLPSGLGNTREEIAFVCKTLWEFAEY
jgi:perosamine synthetase